MLLARKQTFVCPLPFGTNITKHLPMFLCLPCHKQLFAIQLLFTMSLHYFSMWSQQHSWRALPNHHTCCTLQYHMSLSGIGTTTHARAKSKTIAANPIQIKCYHHYDYVTLHLALSLFRIYIDIAHSPKSLVPQRCFNIVVINEEQNFY